MIYVVGEERKGEKARVVGGAYKFWQKQCNHYIIKSNKAHGFPIVLEKTRTQVWGSHLTPLRKNDEQEVNVIGIINLRLIH